MGIWDEEHWKKERNRRKKENGILVRDTNYRVMHMKPIMESWRGYLKEASQPKELGKPFEYVVVQTVRRESGAQEYVPQEPTPPPPGATADEKKERKRIIKNLPKEQQNYLSAGASGTWGKAKSGGVELSELAKQLYQKAVDSGFFTTDDFQNAKVTDIGKQKSGGGGRKIEIKTDVLFGEKTISIKLPGDVQAQSAQGATQARQLEQVLENYYLDDQIDSLMMKELQNLKGDIQGLANKSFLSDDRATRLRSRLAKGNTATEEKIQINKVLSELYKLEIIDDTAALIDTKLQFNKALVTPIADKITELFGDPKSALYRALVKEMLTGEIGFEGIEGAAAQFLASPGHIWDLRDPETIDIFSEVVTLRVALKGGRPSIDSVNVIKKGLGSEISYRWDIKEKVLEKVLEKKKMELGVAASLAGDLPPEQYERSWDPVDVDLVVTEDAGDDVLDDTFEDTYNEIFNDMRKALKAS